INYLPGDQTNAKGFHQIDFIYKNINRTDQNINYRYGFKEVNSDCLDRIEVYSERARARYKGEYEIHYKLNHIQGEFGKQLLKSVETINKKNNSEWSLYAPFESESYLHEFEYFNDVQGSLFGAP